MYSFPKKKFLAIGFYVDDCIIVGQNVQVIEMLVQKLKKQLKIRTLRGNIEFLGISIDRNKDGFLLGQQKFINEILSRHGMQDCHAVRTPGVAGSKLDEFEMSEKIDNILYQEILGSVGYLVTGTRPDLAFTYS